MIARLVGGAPRECREQEPVGRFPGGLAHLALENAELMAERQKLGSELGVTLPSDEQGIDDEADEGVDEFE